MELLLSLMLLFGTITAHGIKLTDMYFEILVLSINFYIMLQFYNPFLILELKHRQTKCSSTDENITSFPDRLSKTDKSRFIGITGRYIATYHIYDSSIGKRYTSNAIPSSCNMYYFEMAVLKGAFN